MTSWQVKAENESGQLMPKGLGLWEVLTSLPLGLLATPIQPTNRQTRINIFKKSWEAVILFQNLFKILPCQNIHRAILFSGPGTHWLLPALWLVQEVRRPRARRRRPEQSDGQRRAWDGGGDCQKPEKRTENNYNLWKRTSFRFI